ncbi:MAG TPA: hypothetical protein PKE12_02440 [Kiritimatiellia bacterium]|nr:hypothetical protein [Kiritimatiellia bacterium]
MNKLLCVFLLAGLGAAAVEAASPPALVNYQGRLLDAVGNPVDAIVSAQVRVYQDETGGSHLWQQAVSNVMVMNGLYDFTFGDTGLVEVLTNETCWLELTLGGETFTPRQRLVSVPYALRVDVADEVEVAVASVPSGLVVMWAGSLDNIPDGWLLCDGSNGTPDLRTKFVYGSSDAVTPGTTGGANAYYLTAAQLPAHTHAGSCSTTGAHTHTASTASAGSHTHSTALNSVSHTHNHRQRSYNGSYPQDSFATHGSGSTTTIGTSSSGNHTHSRTINSGGAHTHSVTINSGGAHSHALTIQSAGGGEAVDNRPATVLLAFIMKS